MNIVIDSGSTKSSWAFENAPELLIETEGMNPYYTQKNDLIKIIRESIEKASLNFPISNVYFYGAGCAAYTNKKIIKEAFHEAISPEIVDVEHDLLGAARATLINQPGVACILGTGSNVGFYDGKFIAKEIFSTGYIFGDEGSGAYIGKIFIADFLNNKLPDDILSVFTTRYDYSKQDIINSVYNMPYPNRFLASFMPFLKDNIDHPYIRQIIMGAFHAFYDFHVSQIIAKNDYPVAFVGSIAMYFEKLLTEVSAKYGITISKILKNPIKHLAKYHFNY